MEDIKFRAWNEKLGMSDPFLLFGLVRFEKGAKGEEVCEIMQFTGIKDSKEQEIYEGDILKGHAFDCTEELVVVGWEPPCFTLTRVKEHNDGFHAWVLTDNWYLMDDEDNAKGEWVEHIYEIVGNIYENKGLLE